MEKKEDLLENFKTAITSTVKSISNENDIEISFEGQSNDDSNLVINLPKITSIFSIFEIDFTVDAIAVLKFSKRSSFFSI